ncbi:Lcl domain-containing protein [Caminibacter pacificus]
MLVKVSRGFLLTLLLITISVLSAEEWKIKVDKTVKKLPLLRDEQNETVYDPNTELIWLDSIVVKKEKKKFNDADKFCEKLSLLGHKDWRLPTAIELISIYDKNNRPHIKSPFKNLGYIESRHCYDAQYWSTSEYQPKRNRWMIYWKYVISYHSNCYNHIDEVIYYSYYTFDKYTNRLHFSCVRKKRNHLDKTLNGLISYLVKAHIAHIKKPQRKKLKKDEFETTKHYIKRVRQAEREYKKELIEYKQKIKKIYPEYVRKAIKTALEYKWGKPLIKNLKYNADEEKFSAQLTFDNNKSFHKNIFIKIPLKSAKKFKENFDKFQKYAVFKVINKEKKFQVRLNSVIITSHLLKKLVRYNRDKYVIDLP